MVYKLVYDSADIGQQDDIFRDQNVCEHLERKIAEAKIRTEEAARIKAERERESLPKPSDYINQLRNLWFSSAFCGTAGRRLGGFLLCFFDGDNGFGLFGGKFMLLYIVYGAV